MRLLFVANPSHVMDQGARLAKGVSIYEGHGIRPVEVHPTKEDPFGLTTPGLQREMGASAVAQVRILPSPEEGVPYNSLAKKLHALYKSLF